MRTVAFVTDLMDRSRLQASLPAVEFATTPGAAVDAEVVIVDLGRFADDVAEIRAAAPAAHLVAVGPHVDADALARARGDGADVVVPRSRFFRDPSAFLP